jgi:hypothetical protein
MTKKTKLGGKPEKKRIKPAKPKSESEDVKSVTLDELMGALMKVPPKRKQNNGRSIT